MRKPLISIIIRTSGEEQRIKHIVNLLCTLKNQTLNFDELIIATEVNGKLIENVMERIVPELHPIIRILEVKAWNRCKTTNRAILESRGDIIVILEDDILLSKDWLKEVIQVFNSNRSKDIGCVLTEVAVPFSRSLLRRKDFIGTIARLIHCLSIDRNLGKILSKRRPYFIKDRDLQEILTLPVSCFACRRRALIEAGLFDETLTEPMRGDDYELGLRIFKKGYRVVLLKRVKAIHCTQYGSKYLYKLPSFWKNFFKTEIYTYIKHYDLLSAYILPHMVYMVVEALAKALRTGKMLLLFKCIEGLIEGLVLGIKARKSIQ